MSKTQRRKRKEKDRERGREKQMLESTTKEEEGEVMRRENSESNVKHEERNVN